MREVSASNTAVCLTPCACRQGGTRACHRGTVSPRSPKEKERREPAKLSLEVFFYALPGYHLFSP